MNQFIVFVDKKSSLYHSDQTVSKEVLEKIGWLRMRTRTLYFLGKPIGQKTDSEAFTGRIRAKARCRSLDKSR